VVEDASERTQMLERALALSPRDPYLLREVANDFSRQRPPDPRTAQLAERMLESFEQSEYNRSMATSWEHSAFIGTAANIHGRLGDYARAEELVLELCKFEEDGEDAAAALSLTVTALEADDLEPALKLLALTERLMERVRTAWLDAEDRTSLEEWETALRNTYGQMLTMCLRLERPQLGRQLVEAYRTTGRLEGDAAFQKLAQQLDE
jgi:hypothetical protein